MADIKQLKRALESARSERQPHEAGWAECYDYSFPERGNGLNGTTLTASDVPTKKNRILDDTLADAGVILSSGIVSGTTPANSLWFGLSAGVADAEDETPEMTDEERWFSNASETIFRNIHGANFDPNAYEGAIDLVAAGWFVMYIDEAEGGGYAFELWPLGQCYISASKASGKVDTIYREYTLTVEQMVNAYGLDNVSEKVRASYQAEKYSDKHTVCHAIYPRRMHVPGARMSRNMPFASVHYETATEHQLRESGYHEFPCAIPRWMLIPGSVYPVGPMARALGSVRSLHDIKTLELMNLDISVGGMWIGVDDGILNPRTVKIGGRKMITAASTDSLKELKAASDFNVAFTAEERLQASIRKIMMADQLQPQDGPAMTATEVHARIQLIRQLLGPIYARLQAEYLQPLLERCFGLAYRAGILGAPPESLRGTNIVAKYVSPLARAQRLEEVSAIDQYVSGAVASAGAIAQADPERAVEILDTVDFVAAQKLRGEALGVPPSVIPTDIQLAKIRREREEKRAAAQEQAAQAEMLKGAAPALMGGKAA